MQGNFSQVQKLMKMAFTNKANESQRWWAHLQITLTCIHDTEGDMIERNKWQ